MSDYPEHDKLSAVQDETQAAGEFLEWLMTTEYTLAVRCSGEETGIGQLFVPAFPDIEQLLARWKGIDRNKIEAEKRQMLASVRAANGG
jgi:hypothetical protein